MPKPRALRASEPNGLQSRENMRIKRREYGDF